MLNVFQLPAAGTVISSNTLIFILAVNEFFQLDICAFEIIPLDQTPPQIQACPNDMTVAPDTNCEFVLDDYIPMVNATDNCSSNLFYFQNPPAGTIITVPTDIVISVYDEADLFSTCQFTVTPEPFPAPVFLVFPPDITKSYTDNCQFLVGDYISGVIMENNCGEPFSFSQYPAGNSYVSTNTVVTTAAFNTQGLSSNCSFTIFLIADTAPLIQKCPADQNEVVDDNCEAPLSDYTAGISVSDNCSTGTLQQTPAPGTIISSPTLVELIAFDDSGNTSTCFFTITPVDQTPPALLDVITNHTVQLDDNCEFILADYTNGLNITDNCSSDFITHNSPHRGPFIQTQPV